MRVNIFDNGLRGRTGAHFDWSHRLARGLRARGWAVQVYGAMQADASVAAALARADCGFTPLFSHFAYAPLDPQADILAELGRQTENVVAELSRASPADLNLFPSLKPLEFYGFAASNLAGATVGYAHADPLHQGSTSTLVWRLAAEHAARRGKQYRLGAIDPVVADFLSSYLGGVPVETFPILEESRGKPLYAESMATIGFFGSQREERGLNLLAPLAEQLLGLGYRVVLHDTHGQFANANGNPNLKVLAAFVDDLPGEIIECDLIVCPMQRENYVHRMSAIACNAVSAGVPFVLPAGTLAAARFGSLGSCRPYLEHSVAGILSAVRELGQDYPRYAQAALRGAQQWRLVHGMDHFLDKVAAKVA